MGAVRPEKSRDGERAPGINVPPPRSAGSATVEDTTSPPSSARGTLKRSPSDSTIRAKAIPKVTEAARHLKGKEIQPEDAFLLSQIDGQLDVVELADLTGLPQRQILASLKRLLKAGLVSV